MSQGNVEIVKAFSDAWNAADMDAVRDLYDSDAVVRPPEGWPVGSPKGLGSLASVEHKRA